MSVRILHCADLHLDTPFDSLSEEKAVIMRKEQRELLLYIADIAVSKKADVVLLAGDLLDSTFAYYETSDALLDALSRISVPVFISPGNHDFYCDASPYSFLEFPKNVHIFTSQSIECVALEELGVRVYGAGFVSNASASLITTFKAEDDDMINLMVIHGNVMGDSYNRITPDDIASSGLDYLALGHVHSYSGIQKAGDTYYAYPGCPQGRGFDETGDKGILFGTVTKDSTELEFIPTAKRKYADLKADMANYTSCEDALESILSSVSENDIVRVTLAGEFGGETDTAALTDKFSERVFSLTVRDRTRSPRNIWEGLSEDTLKGSFLRIMNKKYMEAESDEERAKVVMAVGYALSALENREEYGA